MRKGIKKSVRIFLFATMLLIAIPVALWIAVQNSSVQTFLVEQTTQILQKKLNTTVKIERVDLKLFNRVLLNDVYIEDFNGDTLLEAKRVTAYLSRFSLKNRVITLSNVSISQAYVNLDTDSTGLMNLTALIKSIRKKRDEKPEPFTINLKRARLDRSVFRLANFDRIPMEHGINFKDMLLYDLSANLKGFQIYGDTIGFTVSRISFKEQSGFSVDRLRLAMEFCRNYMRFEKFQLQSMGSDIDIPRMQMTYDGWEAMRDFVNQVTLEGTINTSSSSTNFLSYFAPALKFLNEDFVLKGSFKGTVNDLRLRDIILSTAQTTQLQMNANLTGLPDFENTFLLVDVKNLRTTISDVESLKNTQTGLPLVSLPPNLATLRRINYSGSFTGFLTDFVVFGTLGTGIGDLLVDLSVKPPNGQMGGIKGAVSTEYLHVGQLLSNENVGRTTLNASIDAQTDFKKRFSGKGDINISSFEAKGYSYKDIEITGEGSEKHFAGNVFLKDPNARLNFMGNVDFTDTIPLFDFSAYVPNLDLVKLNLNPKDSISQASFLVTAKVAGNSIDNTQGEVKIVNGFYRNQNGEIKTTDITVTADNTLESKLISLKSEFAEGELRGKYSYTNIFSSMKELAYLYIPALSPDNQKPEIKPTGVENPEFNDYIIKLRVKKTKKFTDVLFPHLMLAENTNVFGIYNPDFQTLMLKVSIPELTFSGNTIKNIVIDGNTNDSLFIASISSPSFQMGGTFVKNISVNTQAINNSLTASIAWDNKTSIKNEGLISAIADVGHKDESHFFDITVLPSNFFLNDTVWNVSESKILIDTMGVTIDNLLLNNNEQSMFISGNVASKPSDSLLIELENIDLSNANIYTKKFGYSLSGSIDGYAKITDPMGQLLFFADLSMDEVALNSKPLGDMVVQSSWVGNDNKLNLNMHSDLEKNRLFSISGDIYPSSKRLDLQASIQNLMLGHVEPILAGHVTDIDGYIVGNVNLTGTMQEPKLDGMLTIVDGIASIDFTKTKYFVSSPLLIRNSDILFTDFKLYDVNNRVTTVNGAVRTGYFKDIKLDLNVTPNNFQFLNTTEKDNDLFYGNVFATGQVRVIGPPNDLIVNASIKTEPRTALFLPLSPSGEVSETDFVNFVNRSSDIFIIDDSFDIEAPKSKSNVALTLDMEVTPDAEVQIIIDKQLGDIIRANGLGNLKMEINPNGEGVKMFGEYAIEQGDYLFTLQGVINKRFKIGQGSTITWNGDIEDAMMDIQAIYSLKTTLSPLNPGTDNEVFKRRTQVDCQTNISGKLMEPSISFDIKVPLAETDESINAVLQDAINTEERLSKQFLSLLVINSFTSDVQEQSAGGFGQGLASTASEMLSNQLSSWLSQWSSAVDIGINYRRGDELSSDEIELALSTHLFNERVTINSNVDVGAQNVNTPFAGDVSVDVKIVPSGKLRAKAFARSNDDLMMVEREGDFTRGAGLMYREDFNTFGELWRKYMRFFRGKPIEATEPRQILSPEVDTLDIETLNPLYDEELLVEIK